MNNSVVNASDIRLYRRLLATLKPYWRLVGLALLAMAAIAALEPLLPSLMQPLVDDSLIAKDKDAMLWVPLAILGVFIAKGVAEYAANVLSQWVAQSAVADLRQSMFARLLHLPLERQQALGSAHLLSRITFDVTQAATALSQVWIILIRDTLIIVGLIGFMLYTSWQLTLFILAIAPIAAWIIHKASGLMRTSSTQVQQSMGRLTHILNEALNGRREISIYAGQHHEQQRFNQAVTTLRQQQMAIVRVASANVPLVQVLAAVAVAAILFVATQLSAQALLSPGELVAFITAMSLLFEPIRRLTAINESLQKGLSAAQSIFSLLDEHPEPNHSQQPLVPIQGHLELRQLSFTYPGCDQPALYPLNLTLCAGQTLALVGASGSGKTTLVNLLCRFYHPTQGQILADGQDITQVPLTDWRDQLALVSQQIVLFDDTIAANIAYGQTPSPEDTEYWARIEAAARAAHAWQFIEKLPYGLHTPIGEGGGRLSGGQRQRLALARAFYKDAPILILDEATSALDAESEQLIAQALRALHGKKTLILIAHRLTSVQHADIILVLDHGRVVQQGTHAQLLAEGGIYADLVAHSRLN